MNKFGIAIILVAASVCLVSGAPNLGSKVTKVVTAVTPKLDHEEGEFTIEPEHIKHHGHKHLGHKVHGHHENSENHGQHEQLEYQDGHKEHESRDKESSNYKKLGHKEGGFKHQEGSYGHHEQPEYHGHGHESHGIKKHGLKHLHGHKLHGLKHLQGHKHHGHKHQSHFPHHDHYEPEHGHDQPEHHFYPHYPHYPHHEEHYHEQPEHYPHHGGKFGGKGGFKRGFTGRNAGAAGAVAFEEQEGSQGSIQANDDERDRIHAEGTRFGQKTGAKGIIGGHFNKVHREDTGLSKHQTINNDKTIIKDKSTGSNDVQFNRHVQDSNNGGVIAAGTIGSDTELANSRLDVEREQDRDLIAQGSQFREKEGAAAGIAEF